MELELGGLRSRLNAAWPITPFLAFGILVSAIQFRSDDASSTMWIILLLVTAFLAGVAVVTQTSVVARIAASSVLSAVAVIGYTWIYNLDAITATSLFLAADAVLILSCFVSLVAAAESTKTTELAAMLLFEGEVASREARDQRQELCRALLSLSQRNESPFSILRMEWPLKRYVEDEAATSIGSEARRIHEHMVRFHTVKAVEQLVRASDVVLPAPGRNSIYVVCPETPSEGVHALSVRITRMLDKNVQPDLIYSSASYPSDGYLLEELVLAADRGRQRWKAELPASPAGNQRLPVQNVHALPTARPSAMPPRQGIDAVSEV